MSSDRTPLIGGEKEKPKSNFAASCSNFSIQYNLAVASVRCAVVRTLLLHETEHTIYFPFPQVTTNSLNLHVHHHHLSVSLCSDWDLQVAIPMMSRIYVPGQTTNHTNHTDEFTEANDWFGPAGETPPLSHNSSNPMSPLYVLLPVFSPPDHLVFFTHIGKSFPLLAHNIAWLCGAPGVTCAQQVLGASVGKDGDPWCRFRRRCGGNGRNGIPWRYHGTGAGILLNHVLHRT